MASASKRELVRLFSAELAREIGVLRRAALASREAATHEEAKPENDKDTRAIEAAYLAGAQADRVRDLERTANALEFLELRDFDATQTIALSAVVELDRDGERSRYFIAPHGGGIKATFEGAPIQIVTPASPLGQALLGKGVGDVVTVRIERAIREYEIIAIA
jgi:transcription elongation GreA/GreB family factor